MAGQTLREVLVKIALEMDTSGYKPPDFSPWQREVDKANQSGNRAAVIFDEMIDGAKVYATEAEKAAAATRKRSAATQADSDISKKWLEREQQRADLVNQVAAGSLKAARGVAFLTAANQEEYQATLRWIAGIQGVMDTFTGVLDAYKAVIAFKRAAAAATAAETAAETALATARGRSAGAGIGSGLAGMGGSAISLRGAGALGVAAGAGYGVYKFGEALGSRFYRDAEVFAQRNGFTQRDPFMGPQGQERADLISADLARIEGSRSARDASFTGHNRLLSMLSGPGDFDKAMALIDRQQAINRGTLNLPKESRYLSPNEESQFQRLEVAQQSIQWEDARAQRLERQSELLGQQLQQQRQLQSAAHELLRVEEDRFRTMEERIGRLAPQEVQRLQQLADKQRSGQSLSLQEAQFLERTGVGGSIAAARFREEGLARGAGGILSAFGEDRGVNQARNNLRSVEATSGLAVGELQSELGKLAQAKKESARELANAIGEVITFAPIVEALTKKFQQETEKTMDAIEKSSVQNRGLLGGLF
jgi:hypothetical protein